MQACAEKLCNVLLFPTNNAIIKFNRLIYAEKMKILSHILHLPQLEKGENKMSYTAFARMREKFGEDAGPKEPYQFGTDAPDTLKSAAEEFIHNRCEELRFDREIEAEENRTGVYQGTSLSNGQIPYNMQMDIDRLCLERALERFLNSGTAEDAFDVYFCYIEMFIGTYESAACRRMVEKLSEYEINGSSLLMKHRDHYSHSVYVFALGLAIYDKNAAYREKYKTFYGFEDDKAAAHHFLQYWGLSSLFHDIGYPFELPFEQIASYFESGGEGRGDRPYISFNDIGRYIRFDEKTKQAVKELYGKEFADSNELFAFDIYKKLGKEYLLSQASIKSVLDTKPSNPDSFSYFMDHAYFSAAVLFKTLCGINGADAVTEYHVDAITAILMHNSMYKFSVTAYRDEAINQPFKPELHPLAYLLMLCDELQCWDRTSYGRNSRRQLHPMDCTFTFDEEKNKIIAQYWNDKDEIAAGKIPKFNADEALEDIKKIVCLDEEIKLEIPKAKEKEADYTGKKQYISDSNFIHLYNFAVALHSRYVGDVSKAKEHMDEDFNKLSLEYKLSNIGQAKAFAAHLDRIGCFYTDKPVCFPMVRKFAPEHLEVMGPLEHERWLREHFSMGWQYSDKYTSKDEREQMRGHKDMAIGISSAQELTEDKVKENYERIGGEEQAKDTEPMNAMLKLINEFDGLRIYRYREEK